ncbi:MAG: hypothetical protein RMN51_08265 [Verrucomicrobiota bacterium]|nr:hypothetical protein [Limisphaera sp.]MDW8382082.1 hypothetical protein [Verrucomicrobiota bacterium]
MALGEPGIPPASAASMELLEMREYRKSLLDTATCARIGVQGQVVPKRAIQWSA